MQENEQPKDLGNVIESYGTAVAVLTLVNGCMKDNKCIEDTAKEIAHFLNTLDEAECRKALLMMSRLFILAYNQKLETPEDIEDFLQRTGQLVARRS